MTVHAAPAIVPCCRLHINQLDDQDRITDDPQHVSCRLNEIDGVAEHLARQIRDRHPDRSPGWVGSLVGLTREQVERLQ